jgi:hypothetical protein
LPVGDYPSVDESFGRLHRAGWSVGDVATPAGWCVCGTNGDVNQPYCLLLQQYPGLSLPEETLLNERPA